MYDDSLAGFMKLYLHQVDYFRIINLLFVLEVYKINNFKTVQCTILSTGRHDLHSSVINTICCAFFKV